MSPEQHDDDATRRARAQQVALFRYQLICPALDPDLSTKARGRVVRAIAARTHAGPFGGQHRYSRDTLDRWIRRYRTGGLDALAPSTRQPGSRIDTTVLELAADFVAYRMRTGERTRDQGAALALQLLAARGVGRATIKKRGSAGTPEALRPQLQLRGDAEATVVLTRVAGAGRQGGEDGIQPVDHRLVAADHHAVAAFQAPHAAGDAGVDEADALPGQDLAVAHRVVEVRVAAIHD